MNYEEKSSKQNNEAGAGYVKKGNVGITEGALDKSIWFYYNVDFVTDCKNILKINLGYVIIKHINVSETTGVI